MTTDIVDRIVKLLRLAKSPHPGEAESALRKAYDLAAQHHIDISRCQDAAGKGAPPSVTEARTRMTRWSCEHKWARKLIHAFFDVTVVDSSRASGEAIWVGVPENIAIAQHVFTYTVDACRRAMKAERRHLRTLNQRRSFIRSFFSGLARVLEENPIRNDPQANALVLNDRARRKRYVELMGTKTQHVTGLAPDRTAYNAAHAGFQHGRATSIRRPVEGAAVERLAINA